MSNTIFKRVLPVFLAALLLVNCAPIFAEPSDAGSYVFPQRTPVHLSQMTADNFNASAMEEALGELESAVMNGSGFDAVKAAYDRIVEQYDRLVNDYNLAELYYYTDVTDNDAYDFYSTLSDRKLVYYDRMCIALKAVLDSDYGSELTAYINSDSFVKRLMSYEPMTEEQFLLSSEALELANRYDNLDSGSESFETEAAALYLELLDNMIAMANCSERYSSYAEMAYDDTYYRDYTPGEAAVIHNWAKQSLVPLLDSIVYSLFADRYSEYSEFLYTSLYEDELLECLQPCLSSVSDKSEELFEIMTGLGLYDISESPNKYPGAFTTKLDFYGVPFLFMSPDGQYTDITGFIHEFGHCLEFYVNTRPSAYDYDCIDVCEIDSVGMEMLMTNFYTGIFGEDLAVTAKLVNLFNTLTMIVNGCAFDEFQQAALEARAAGSLNTPEDVNNMYLEIESQYYGEHPEYYTWGSSWAVVPHNFQTPFYYISYSTSGAAALGLLIIADENYEMALEYYNELIKAGCVSGYSSTRDLLGLPNPLTEEGCELLGLGLYDYYAQLTDSYEQAA